MAWMLFHPRPLLRRRHGAIVRFPQDKAWGEDNLANTDFKSRPAYSAAFSRRLSRTTHPIHPARGFTLVELLVVLVIIAVGISTAVIALRPDQRGMVREEADRLAILLGLANEESALGGAAMAWVGREDGYEFQKRSLSDLGPEWMVLRGDDLLHPRKLRSGATIRSIQVDGKTLELGQRVVLGNRGARELLVEIALGDTRARVTRMDGRFKSALLPGEGA